MGMEHTEILPCRQVLAVCAPLLGGLHGVLCIRSDVCISAGRRFDGWSHSIDGDRR